MDGRNKGMREGRTTSIKGANQQHDEQMGNQRHTGVV